MKIKFSYLNSLLLLALSVLGTTTTLAASSNQVAWAEVFEGTEGPEEIVGTPEDDQIDSKGGNDANTGDVTGGGSTGSGDDKINSGEGDDVNTGDVTGGFSDGTGDDKINS